MQQQICYELKIFCDTESLKHDVINFLHSIDEHEFIEGCIDCDFDYDEDTNTESYFESHSKQAPIIFYSENFNYLDGLQKKIQEVFQHKISLVLQPIADQNWRESWKASFKPVHISDKLVVLPPWENPENFSVPYKVVIDPGMAFGTGQHETTRLCLELLYTLPVPQKVFDVGCGSGILSIASSLYGASYILGCDIDEESVRISQKNAFDNKVSNATFVATPIDKIEESDFDLIFANIQMKPLKKIMPYIVAKGKDACFFIFSGLLAEEKEEFTEILLKHGIKILGVHQLGNWLAFLGQK